MVPARSSLADEAEMETLKFNTGQGVPGTRAKEPNAAGTQGAEPLILSSVDREGSTARF